MEEIAINFVPCDLHPDRASIHFEMYDDRPVFKCFGCVYADLLKDEAEYLAGKWD